MRNFVFIYFLLTSFCVGNHAQVTPTLKNEELITIDLDNLPEADTLKLSSLFKPAKTIILETNENCLIGGINAIQAFDDYLFVLDMQANSLFVFNREGKFIRKIGSIGKGPGEYSMVMDFTIDPDKREIYLLDINTNRIHQYTLEGVYLRTVTSLCNARIKSIQYHNGALFTESKKDNAASSDCMLQKIDPEYGHCEASYLSAAQYNLGWNELYFVNTISRFYGKTGQSPKFVQLFMDTVMTIRQGALIPYLAVKSKNWISANDLKNAIQKDPSEWHRYLSMRKDISLNIQNYMENEKIIFFSYERGDRRSNTILYDKKSHTAVDPKIIVNDLMYVGSGLDVQYHFYDRAGAYYYISTAAFSFFIEEIEQNKLRPDLDKYAQLKELIEESNPVVFYYEYRD